MKLDSVSVPVVNTTGKVSSPAPAKEAVVALSAGDVVRARVVSSEDGVVTLKTAEGMVFSARLEDGVELPPGAFAKLVVTQSAENMIVMSLAGQNSGVSAVSQLPEPVQAIALQLSAMGFSPDGEMLKAMQDILSANPGIAPGEAAFIAANRLPAEPAVMEAVHRLFTGGADTAQLLSNLENTAAKAGLESSVAQAGFESPATKDGLESTAQTAQTAAQITATATEGSEATVKSPEAAVKFPEAAVKSPEAEVKSQEAAGKLPEAAGKSQEAANAAAPSVTTPEAATIKADGTAQGAGRPQEFTQWLAKALALDADVFTDSGLSSSPLLKGLSSRSLAGMAESLQSIAASMPELENERELFQSISRFAKELFLEKDMGAGDVAAKLKSVREELYVKLAYFKDAVEASGAGSKEAVLQQTTKLMEHVRVLNNLDQFAYVQIPLHENLGRGAAELYIYKRDKGGQKRIDPEDVKILLALDLEHMGHLESFIEVRGREISLRCEVENESIASVFRQDTTKLYKMLDEIGYKFTNFTALTKKGVTNVENSLLALLDYEKSKSPGVDFTV